MAKVLNPGRVPVTLTTLHVVPACGDVEVTNDTLRECMRSIGGLVAIGDLAVEWDDEDPESNPEQGSSETPAVSTRAKKPAPDA